MRVGAMGRLRYKVSRVERAHKESTGNRASRICEAQQPVGLVRPGRTVLTFGNLSDRPPRPAGALELSSKIVKLCSRGN